MIPIKSRWLLELAAWMVAFLAKSVRRIAGETEAIEKLA